MEPEVYIIEKCKIIIAESQELIGIAKGENNETKSH
jgi:hypothetical protein